MHRIVGWTAWLAIGLLATATARADEPVCPPAPAEASLPVCVEDGPEPCWFDCLFDDKPLLKDFRKKPLFWDLKYSVGGEVRYRYMDEQNRLRPEGTRRRDTYDLWRMTPFVEIGNDWITGYVQAIDASIFDEELAPVPIDENRSDLLQYYIDLNFGEVGDGTLHFRGGRQFLKYGNQFFVSPLGWANTWRNFEGVRFYYQSGTWDIDAFAVQPVNGAAVATQYRPVSRDFGDPSVWFGGVYASRKQTLGGAVDGYWFWNKETEALAGRHDGNRHTLGLRYFGSQPVGDMLPVAGTWAWDFEGGWQFGDDNFGSAAIRDVSAGFASAIGKFTFTEVPWTPTLTGLFWWGSGGNTPGSGTINTLFTLYPFGHYYWGILDNFNGCNLVDYSVQLTVKPHKKATMQAAWHWFDKAAKDDAIYSIGNVPFGGFSTSRHIGNELDLIGTYAVSANIELQFGYSWFWYGAAVEEQPSIRRGDAHQLYLMTTWGF